MGSLRDQAERVRQASQDGMDLDEIDAQIIEPADVTNAAKGVLWMIAFAAAPPERQSQVVREHLVIVAEQHAALH